MSSATIPPSAIDLKAQGNHAFSHKEYFKAIKAWAKALMLVEETPETLPWISRCWSNIAAANIHLSKYLVALMAAFTAMEKNRRNAKAYLHISTILSVCPTHELQRSLLNFGEGMCDEASKPSFQRALKQIPLQKPDSSFDSFYNGLMSSVLNKGK